MRYEVRRIGANWEVTPPTGSPDMTQHRTLTEARNWLREQTGWPIPKPAMEAGALVYYMGPGWLT